MYRIVEFYAENFKRLRLVEFKPIGRMQIFTGKNGQGKTSALDALPYVLAGKKWSPDMPTRRGATHHKVKLGLKGEKGSFTVTRTQSGLKLEMAPGCTAWDTPQAMLGSIYDELTMDPIEFIRMGKDAEGKRSQVDILRSAIVLDVDLNQLAGLSATDFNKRREVNREVERLKAEIAGIPIQPGLPEKPIDITAIQAKIREATEANRNIIQQIEARAQMVRELAEAEEHETRNEGVIASTHQKIEQLTAALDSLAPAGRTAAEIRDGLEALRDRAQALPDLDGLARSLAAAIAEARTRALNYIPVAGMRQTEMAAELDMARKTLKSAEKQKAPLSQAVADLRVFLEQTPRPAMVDTANLTDELNQAQTVNREIDKRDRAQDLARQKEEKEAEARQLTRNMEQREEQKRAAIAAAKMPIEGLTFTAEAGKEEILFQSVPISQLGEAQQIKISIAIALAKKPQLRIIRIPHGEALDDDSMAALAQMAEEMDFYVWMARVDTSGKLGIYLEDGEVKAINEEPKKEGGIA